jgi:hypothetical protein
MAAAEVYCQLVRVYGNDVMSWQSVAKWRAHFRTGRISTDDCERSGRPTTASTPDKRCGKCSSQKQKNYVTIIYILVWTMLKNYGL